MQELLFCVAALLLGPIIYQVTTQKARTYAFFDGFVLVGVGALVLGEVLPQTVQDVGFEVLPVAVFGFLFPYILESRLHTLPVSPRTILSGLIVVGLVLHQLLDGAALHDPSAFHVEGEASTHHDGPVTHLALAVILHQVPKGFFLWELVRKAKGQSASVLVIAALVAATVAGHLAGSRLLPALTDPSLLYFQAFIAGGLLHVVVHHVPGRQEFGRRPLWNGIGALGAVAAYLFAVPDGEKTLEGGRAFVSLALDSSPPILLGLLAAGVLQAFVSAGPLALFRGRTALSQSLRGVFLGAPLPICSCGVTPVYHTLVRRGVPAAAALAFLIATPEIGFDSIFLSLRLLGWKITLLRLAMAFGVAVLTGVLLARMFRVPPDAGHDHIEPLTNGPPASGICARAVRSLHFGCVEMVDDIGAWLVAGIAIAAAMTPYLETVNGWVTSLPPGLDILALSLCGLPLYVCASGATPLAAVLLQAGVSPGAVLAFLITGPTTNVTTFGILSQLHGPRRAVAFAVAVFVLAVAFGLVVNEIAPRDAVVSDYVAGETHGGLEIGSAIVLATLLALSVLRLGPRGFLARLRVASVERPEQK